MTSSADVVAHLPDGLSLAEVDHVRDALVEALTALLEEWQYRTDFAAALADPARAIEQYLEALAGDRGAFRAEDEGDETLRPRMFSVQACVTEPAIVAGVNAILAPFTSTECQLNDAVLDRWFINNRTNGNGGPAVWHSFVGSGPNYPDRLLADDAANNGGKSRPNSKVGGARVYSDQKGRHLLLRVPDISYLNRDAAFVLDGITPANGLRIGREGGFFVGTTSSPAIAAFPNAISRAADAVYRAIANFVDAVTGQSVRWTMIADLPG